MPALVQVESVSAATLSLAVEAYGVVIGTISTLMSIGGGAYVVILMTLYGRSLHQAVATSSGFGPLIAIPGLVGFMWAGWGTTGVPPGTIGYVSLLGAALAIPTGLLAAPLGAKCRITCSSPKSGWPYSTQLHRLSPSVCRSLCDTSSSRFRLFHPLHLQRPLRPQLATPAANS